MLDEPNFRKQQIKPVIDTHQKPHSNSKCHIPYLYPVMTFPKLEGKAH